MKKAFFVNGGAGRVLCSIPALERYAETNDDFIIVSESWSELFMLNPTLRDKVYPVGHKDLFEDKLKDKKIVSTEPYRVNQYFNQKCNLIQAFDIEINELDEIPESRPINIELTKEEQISGYNIVTEVKTTLKKDKVVVFQPFGSAVKIEGRFIVDSSGRSFELSNTFDIIKNLNKHFSVIVMSDIDIPGIDELGVSFPRSIPLNVWAGIINASDYFLGCDSVGQHLAHALKKPATVVIGSTYPENISYPDNKDFKIIDLGKNKRKYSPIRIGFAPATDRNNESLMMIDNDRQIKRITDSVVMKIGKSTNKPNLMGESKYNPINPMDPGAQPIGEYKGFAGMNRKKTKEKKTVVDEVLELNNVEN